MSLSRLFRRVAARGKTPEDLVIKNGCGSGRSPVKAAGHYDTKLRRRFIRIEKYIDYESGKE